MLLLFNHRKFFLKCKLPLFALIKFNIVFKNQKRTYCEKRCGGSSVNNICFNKINFLKLLPSCKYVHPLQRSYLKH